MRQLSQKRTPEKYLPQRQSTIGNTGEGTSSKQMTTTTQHAMKHLRRTQQRGGEANDNDPEEDFYMLRAVLARMSYWSVHQVRGMREIDPIYAAVKVEGVETKMEIETVTFVTVIDKVTKAESFPNLPLNPTDIVLQTYGTGKLCVVDITNGIEVEWNREYRE